jgi:hypothetical protein
MTLFSYHKYNDFILIQEIYTQKYTACTKDEANRIADNNLQSDLPTERGKVKPVDCPLVDDRPRVLKSNGRKKQEKRGGIGISEAAKSLA